MVEVSVRPPYINIFDNICLAGKYVTSYFFAARCIAIIIDILYNNEKEEAVFYLDFIPNKEVLDVFRTSTKGRDWTGNLQSA